MSTFNVPPTILNALLSDRVSPFLQAIRPEHDCVSFVGRRLKADDLSHIAKVIANSPFERILLSYNQIGIYQIPHSHCLWNIPKIPTRTGAEPCGLVTLGQAIAQSNIRVVDLSHNRLSGAMIADFIATLKDSKVTHLLITHNQLGINGVCEVIKACHDTSITSLDISANGVTIPEAYHLYAALNNSKITQLTIDNFSPRALEAIKKVLAQNKQVIEEEHERNKEKNSFNSY